MRPIETFGGTRTGCVWLGTSPSKRRLATTRVRRSAALESVAAAAAWVEERHGRLDLLVNNAGILPETPGVLDAGGVAATLDTNVVGVVRVTEAFLPLLRRSDAARPWSRGRARCSSISCRR